MNNASSITKAINTLDVIYKTLCADDPFELDAIIEIRTQALTGDDRRFFTADPVEELGRTRDEWAAVYMETCDRAAVGAFVGNQLVGIMTVTRLKDDTTGKTAYYGGAYVLEEYRHTEVPGRLITMLDQWAVENGCDKAMFTIHPKKADWIKTQRRYGAKVVGKKSVAYADGSVGSISVLMRPLRPTNNNAIVEGFPAQAAALH
jgi:GNAT superfamily N-acetyltransferase